MFPIFANFDGYGGAERLEEGLVLFFGAYLMILLFTMIVSFVIYVFQSLGLYGMSKNAGISNPWLAWIPVGNLWCIGTLAERSNLHYGKGKGAWSKLLPAFAIAIFLFLPLIFLFAVIAGLYESLVAVLLILIIYLLMMGVALALAVMNYVALYKIYRLFDPDNATLYMILTVFVNISQPVIMFLLRDRYPGGGKTPPAQGNDGAPFEPAEARVLSDGEQSPPNDPAAF
ncbi:MAG: hypothetical protein IKJ74_03870 [Clostridia bacterium]|nr:hypothetical protein [Clostridia bacterium]